MAVQMANEGLISKQEAVSWLEKSSTGKILSPQTDLSSGVPEGNCARTGRLRLALL
jgi:hypothetical protein